MKSREQEIDRREKSATQVVRDLDERQEAVSELKRDFLNVRQLCRFGMTT